MTSRFINVANKVKVAIKLLILFFGAIINLACANQANVQQDFLVESVLSTSFTAVVSHTKVTKLSSSTNDGDEYELSAKVINHIAGVEQKEINYRLFVEPSEKIILNQDPVIIFLCESKGQYYWPGVGSEFPATEDFIAIADKAAKMKLSQSPTELDSHCDN